MRSITGLAAALVCSIASAAYADSAPLDFGPGVTPTADQQKELADCSTMARAVQLFAQARDQGVAKDDAFKLVTRGQTPYVAGSKVDQTMQWAYAHPQESAEAVTGHFYGRCVLQTFDVLTPDAESELQGHVQACQKDNAARADLVRPCINGKTIAMVSAALTPKAAPAAGTAAPAMAVASKLPQSLNGIATVSLGMAMADARKTFHGSGELDTDEQGAEEYSYMISHDHGFVVLLTEPGKPDTVYGVEYHGGADVDMEPVLGLKLGQGAAAILSKVGPPSSKQPVPNSYDSVWTYEDRNYSFTVSSGGDLICIRVYGYAGLAAPSQDP